MTTPGDKKDWQERADHYKEAAERREEAMGGSDGTSEKYRKESRDCQENADRRQQQEDDAKK